VTRPSRNDIRTAAIHFVHEWKDETSERGEAQSFWTDFLTLFGVERRRVRAAFERHARRSSTGGSGFIDVIWPGMLLAEHKSRGEDLGKAIDQALDYLDSLADHELPRLVVASDFARMAVLDLDEPEREVFEFPLTDLPRQIDRFLALAGYASRRFDDEDAVNVRAAELLGRVYDELEATSYGGHPLRVLIVRALFVLFGDETGLWPRKQFADLLLDRTSADGADLGMWLTRLFGVLDTPDNQRSSALDEDLNAFPYVNGGLFAEHIEPPDTTRTMRDRLVETCQFDWSQISPAIFGSMFQSVMDPEERRALGMHYTSERNILKVVSGLFLDDLRAELEACGKSRQRLRAFHDKLASLKFFDPACGCGNFLLIAYRELRRLERGTLLKLNPGDIQGTLDIANLRKVTVEQFYGIELEEFPARIAETAMYLVDHLENEALAATFGINMVDLPLRGSAHITVGNALRIDWSNVLPPEQCSYLLGNPPFAGQVTRDADQTADLRLLWGSQYGRWLDYVSGWYIKAKDYLARSPGRAAFVSTNSVSQGEQVARIWRPLVDAGIEIDFAHRTFAWSNEARGMAHVHCVIIGFSPGGRAKTKLLYDYPDIGGDPIVRQVKSISPYLVEGPVVLVDSATRPISPYLPPVQYGCKPADGGFLIVDAEARPFNDAIAMGYLRPYLGSQELLHDEKRWCLWLVDAEPQDFLRSRFIRERLEGVRDYRENCGNPDTIKYADQPWRFFRIPQPVTDYTAIPRVGMATRRWLPVAHVKSNVIASDALFTAVDPTGLVFGLLSSTMYAVWLRTVGGRLKSDPRFSALVVHNTFPFPETRAAVLDDIREGAEAISGARAESTGSLADLYEPLGTPPALLTAHAKLDRAVDAAFGRRALRTDADRLALLFERYEAFVANNQLFPPAPRQRRRRAS